MYTYIHIHIEEKWWRVVSRLPMVSAWPELNTMTSKAEKMLSALGTYFWDLEESDHGHWETVQVQVNPQR